MALKETETFSFPPEALLSAEAAPEDGREEPASELPGAPLPHADRPTLRTAAAHSRRAVHRFNIFITSIGFKILANANHLYLQYSSGTRLCQAGWEFFFERSAGKRPAIR
jgi:hypothetical protein